MKKIIPSVLTATLLVSFTACGGGGSSTTPTTTPTVTDPIVTDPTPTTSIKVDVSGEISVDTHWTADNVYRLNGRVVVNNGATLTIDPGTTIIGVAGTGAASSWLIIDKGSKIEAAGTVDNHIVFTSETAYDGGADAVGQWGSLVIIGNAAMDAQVQPYEVDTSFVPGTGVADDNSGTLTYVDILNSGITIEENKELNGLSLVGVGSGTTIDHINVNKSDDDCIEIWGGTVNVSNATVSECTDDQFDIDDGYSGTVTNLTINQSTGNAGIEMSGNTAATFDGLNINVTNSAKEGAIYFKNDGIGGHFNNTTIRYDVDNGYGVIHSAGAFDAANTSVDNTTIYTSLATVVTGDNNTTITGLEDAFANGTNNTITAITNTIAVKPKIAVSGEITTDTTWTANNVYKLAGKVVVNNGATLTIEPGTTVIGQAGTGAASSWLVIDKGSKIEAAGTADKHIVFTSETAYDGAPAAVGQWGSLVIIGNAAMDAQVQPYEVDPTFVPGTGIAADNSGTLTYVDILNSGITIEENKELNGLSLVGVGSGTTIDHINVNKSDDDCIEIWGGTVNVSNSTVSECTDDQFDIDDGYSGTVTNLTINQSTGNAGIEMSGNTAATFDGLNINVTNSAKEGAIYFKNDGIGGHFNNTTIRYDVDNGYGVIHSAGAFDAANTSVDNTTIYTSLATVVTGDNNTTITGLEDAFANGTNNSTAVKPKIAVSGEITTDTTWTANNVYKLAGKVVVNNGATLTIEPGTTVIGQAGTGAASSWLVIDKGSKIEAAGTADKHIVFTSETAYDGAPAAVGQWGSLVIIGNAAMDAQVQPYEVDPTFVPGTGIAADNSGTLTYVDILNSGITIEENKELNGLSLVGVGSGTTIDHINVNKSDDDCIEIWGGTVNVSNSTVSECTDDQFDIDDGYSGTVTNLTINQSTGNAGIEMSGNTAATFDGLNINVTNSAKEGAIYFKNDGIGGHFNNVTITTDVANGYGVIYSAGVFDANNTSFQNTTIYTTLDPVFVGDSAAEIKTKFESQ
ncbi:hypothetical protein FJR03_09695 [Sulfurimonas marina]|uniref:Right-handed parallel beta-helix repeat-containing protein n=2 Tax=Sulfurimonas marina TaxID=2590551 RepID=A0A7M1AX47_9BACT|nr:hypothetical protein FJR03_09695 [Sulfurimonas marina]